MMKFIAKAFSKMLGFLSILIILAGTIAGGYFGGEELYWITDIRSDVVCIFLGGLVGFIVSFVFVIIVFGLMAQIIAINEKMDKVLKRQGD